MKKFVPVVSTKMLHTKKLFLMEASRKTLDIEKCFGSEKRGPATNRSD